MSYTVRLNQSIDIQAEMITDLKQMSGSLREAIHIDMPAETDIEALKQMVGSRVTDIVVTLEKSAEREGDLGDGKGTPALDLDGNPVIGNPVSVLPELDAAKGYRISEVRKIYSPVRVVATMILLV